MKHGFTILLAVLIILLLLGGCSKQYEGNSGKTIQFYFCNTDISYNEPDGLISAELRSDIGNIYDIESVLKEYLKGPSSDKHYLPLPAETALTEAQLGDDVLYIALDIASSELSGIDRTLAFVCITQTFQEITGVDSVIIDIAGGTFGNNVSVEFDKDNIITVDNSLYTDR